MENQYNGVLFTSILATSQLDLGIQPQPEEPVCIDIPFGSLKPGTAAFDIRLWITTSGFETGGEYEAVLPIGGMISWWRWASLDEAGDLRSMVISPPSTDQSDTEDNGSPALPKEQQLHVHTSKERVIFTCIGRHAGP
jgi:hypothetical protein